MVVQHCECNECYLIIHLNGSNQKFFYIYFITIEKTLIPIYTMSGGLDQACVAL